ncbi:MAG: type II toxin-antitoxin system RelE/ParE family toxin [Chloroflexi bacterium]|nr:type II toxin-antitoxin system RelE/ParE family toxin [Chloroflexota bacterium]
MAYRVEFEPGASDDLRRLDSGMAQRILRRLRWLSENAEAIALEALSGEFRGSFKLRVGSYRVIYSVDKSNHSITAHAVGHRSDIYKAR